MFEINERNWTQKQQTNGKNRIFFRFSSEKHHKETERTKERCELKDKIIW